MAKKSKKQLRRFLLALVLIGWAMFTISWFVKEKESPTPKKPQSSFLFLSIAGPLLSTVAHAFILRGGRKPGYVLMVYGLFYFGFGWAFFDSYPAVALLCFVVFCCMCMIGIMLQCIQTALDQAPQDLANKSLLQSVSWHVFEGGDEAFYDVDGASQGSFASPKSQ